MNKKTTRLDTEVWGTVGEEPSSHPGESFYLTSKNMSQDETVRAMARDNERRARLSRL